MNRKLVIMTILLCVLLATSSFGGKLSDLKKISERAKSREKELVGDTTKVLPDSLKRVVDSLPEPRLEPDISIPKLPDIDWPDLPWDWDSIWAKVPKPKIPTNYLKVKPKHLEVSGKGTVGRVATITVTAKLDGLKQPQIGIKVEPPELNGKYLIVPNTIRSLQETNFVDIRVNKKVKVETPFRIRFQLWVGTTPVEEEIVTGTIFPGEVEGTGGGLPDILTPGKKTLKKGVDKVSNTVKWVLIILLLIIAIPLISALRRGQVPLQLLILFAVLVALLIIFFPSTVTTVIVLVVLAAIIYLLIRYRRQIAAWFQRMRRGRGQGGTGT